MVSQSSLTSGYSPARLIFAFLSSMFFSLWANAQTQVLTVPAQGTANTPFTVQWSGGRSYIYLEQRIGNGAWVKIGQYGASGSAQITRAEGTYSYRVNDCVVRGSSGVSGHDCTTFWPTIRTITISSASPSGTLTSTSPCYLPGPESTTRCTVDISITKQNTPIACLWILNPTKLIGCEGHSSWVASWIFTITTPHNMELRAHADWPASTDAVRQSGTLLAQLTIVARLPTGTLTTNSPCSLPGPEASTRCTVNLNASKQNVPIACIWGTNPTQLISCSGQPSWNSSYNQVTTITKTVELRGHHSQPQATEAGRSSGVLLDQKAVVAARTSSSSSSTTVSSAQSSSMSSSSAPTTQAGTTFYTYDELGRLKTVTHPNNVKNTYEYDAAGNRTKKELTN